MSNVVPAAAKIVTFSDLLHELEFQRNCWRGWRLGAPRPDPLSASRKARLRRRRRPLVEPERFHFDGPFRVRRALLICQSPDQYLAPAPAPLPASSWTTAAFPHTLLLFPNSKLRFCRTDSHPLTSFRSMNQVNTGKMSYPRLSGEAVRGGIRSAFTLPGLGARVGGSLFGLEAHTTVPLLKAGVK